MLIGPPVQLSNDTHRKLAGPGYSGELAYRFLLSFRNLEGRATVDEFLEWFPGVSQEQVNAVLGHTSASLADPVRA